jgi:cytochrome c oxidase assembly factor CtaG
MRRRLPPSAVGVSVSAALVGCGSGTLKVQAASQLMYCGGDLAELALAVALFATWYHTGRATPRNRNARRADHQQINRIRTTWRAAFIDPQQG